MRKQPDRDQEEVRTPSDWIPESNLPYLLKYDTWTPEIGLPLLCNIDPLRSIQTHAEPEFIDYDHVVVHESEGEPPVYERIALILDDPANLFPPDKEGEQMQEASEIRSVELTRLGRESTEKYEFFELLRKLEERHDAQQALFKAWSIYVSNPQHSSLEPQPPSYLVSWALSKSMTIPWLTWAIDRGLIDVSLDHGNRTSRQSEKPLKQRERNTLLCFIAALLTKLDIDPAQRGIAKRLVGYVEEIGVTISDQKVRDILSALDDAVELRKRS